MSHKYVYFFGGGRAEGNGQLVHLLGGKGANLAEMTNIGLPVPAGFTITVEACEYASSHDMNWPPGMEAQVRRNLARLEKLTGKRLGDPRDPLLVSVRSGAARSMPGMMETILNLGLTDESVCGLAAATQDERFARDAYRRLIQMYANVVAGLEKDAFEEKLRRCKEQRGAQLDTELDAAALRELCAEYKDYYRQQTGSDFPQDPWEQLRGAINAVFRSWNAPKAVTYRQVENITDIRGTAANVQQMVFGNMGETSGTGVCFTRDPSTGENVYYGEMLINAQGEDVVAGIRTPLKLVDLQQRMPDMYDQLLAVRATLEVHFGDMQDLEFTFERGRLYILQTRTGKRTPQAAFRIAVEQATRPLLSRRDAQRLVRKGYLSKAYAAAACKPVISRDQALLRITAREIERLFFPVIDPQVAPQELAGRKLAVGVNAVPGAACGKVVFSAPLAEELAGRGEEVVLVRKETSPEDVGGMQAAKGILTKTGGKTSHAAVVARGWGKCCIVGCEALEIDYENRQMSVNGTVIREGDYLTLDGTTGTVYSGRLALVRPEPPPEFETLLSWADRRRRLKVRANADTPADARRALELGAEGIGLCRTEHMFFGTPERRLSVQAMMLAASAEERRHWLERLLPFQREDFIGLFEVMDGRPVTIRLLDPPLHEFIPKTVEQVEALAETTGMSSETIRARAEQLHEANPMLGYRGCRLCITHPEILEMQVRAIIEAAIEVRRRGRPVRPEIMIPLTIAAKELARLVERTRAVADEILRRHGVRLPYSVGTMIETPRAALTADEIAAVAEFFSFGTNDLTQLTLALSRDDANKFLPVYCDAERAAVFPEDPFQSLDQVGVGRLVSMGIELGRRTRPGLKVGVCGEHGGEPKSVEFCHRVGMDYVSCSPFRIPVARLAAAQAAISAEQPRPLRRPARATAKRAAAKRPTGRAAAGRARRAAGRVNRKPRLRRGRA